MRRSRFKIYRKRKKWSMIAKLLIIFYIVTFTSSYLFTSTGAYFTDQITDKDTIKAGEWWDQSDLGFTGKNTQNVKACPPAEIEVNIKNNGFSMIDTSEYEIYYVKKGNPKNQGKKIAEGTIDPLETNESGKLSFQADKTGSYMFKAFQRPGYNDNDDERQAIWSEKVMVKCIENKQQNDNSDQRHDNQTNDESSGKERSRADDNTPSDADEQHSKSTEETKKHNKKEKADENETNEQVEPNRDDNQTVDEPDRQKKDAVNTEAKPADEDREDQADE